MADKVTHEQAQKIALDYIAHAFARTDRDRPRHCIPVQDTDHDVVLMRYIKEREEDETHGAPPSPPRHLYQNSQTIYCAESLEEATRLFEEDMGEDLESLGEGPFVQIPDGKRLEIGSEDPYEVVGEVERRVRLKSGEWNGPYYFLKKTAAEWAAAHFGSGHFSGGDY